MPNSRSLVRDSLRPSSCSFNSAYAMVKNVFCNKNAKIRKKCLDLYLTIESFSGSHSYQWRGCLVHPFLIRFLFSFCFFSEFLRFPSVETFSMTKFGGLSGRGVWFSRIMFLTCLVLLYLGRFRLIDIYLSVGRYRRQGEPNLRHPRPWQGGLRRQNDNNQRTAGEFSVSFLLQGRLLYGYTIRELNHSHPFSNKASSNDNVFAKEVKRYLLQHNRSIPCFKIYYVKE